MGPARPGMTKSSMPARPSSVARERRRPSLCAGLLGRHVHVARSRLGHRRDATAAATVESQSSVDTRHFHREVERVDARGVDDVIRVDVTVAESQCLDGFIGVGDERGRRRGIERCADPCSFDELARSRGRRHLTTGRRREIAR